MGKDGNWEHTLKIPSGTSSCSHPTTGTSGSQVLQQHQIAIGPVLHNDYKRPIQHLMLFVANKQHSLLYFFYFLIWKQTTSVFISYKAPKGHFSKLLRTTFYLIISLLWLREAKQFFFFKEPPLPPFPNCAVETKRGNPLNRPEIKISVVVPLPQV